MNDHDVIEIPLFRAVLGRSAPALILLGILGLSGLCARAAGRGEAKGAAPASGHEHHAAPAKPAVSPAGSPSSAPPIATWFAGGGELHVPAFYESFEGIDLTSLTPVQRERFLHWVNTEFCTCGQQGCRRDTIANCIKNDALCPRAPVRLRQILDRVKKGETLPGTVVPENASIPSGAAVPPADAPASSAKP
jgi:hypothetical protein